MVYLIINSQPLFYSGNSWLISHLPNRPVLKSTQIITSSCLDLVLYFLQLDSTGSINYFPLEQSKKIKNELWLICDFNFYNLKKVIIKNRSGPCPASGSS
jgi:hypothetical protein